VTQRTINRITGACKQKNKNMQSLSAYLRERIQQLEHRKMMIPRYVEQPQAFLGKKDFSLDDLPKIEEDLKECRIALCAIESMKKENLLLLRCIEVLKVIKHLLTGETSDENASDACLIASDTLKLLNNGQSVKESDTSKAT
jgi:hypothetical protein